MQITPPHQIVLRVKYFRMSRRSTLTLPDLPYDYSALEPVISGEIMELHHKKHHQTYVTNFNATAAQLAEADAKTDVPKLIQLQPAVTFNGGGEQVTAPACLAAAPATTLCMASLTLCLQNW